MHKAVYIICKYVACTYVLWKDSNPNGENEVTSREHMPAKTRNTYVQWCAWRITSFHTQKWKADSGHNFHFLQAVCFINH